MAHQADLCVLFTRTGAQEDRARGITAFLVDLDQPGVSRSTFKDVGSGVVGRGSIFFDDVEVPAENMIGDEGMGFKQVMAGFRFLPRLDRPAMYRADTGVLGRDVVL